MSFEKRFANGRLHGELLPRDFAELHRRAAGGLRRQGKGFAHIGLSLRRGEVMDGFGRGDLLG